MTSPGAAELMASASGLGVRIDVDGPVLERYLISRAPVVIIIGPVGSGKSRGSIYKLLLNALRQKILPGEKVARRRSYVIRNTFDELERTAMKDWLEQFPEERWGRLLGQKPATQVIRTDTLEWEVTFLALDKEDDVKKLLSAQVSDMWINELQWILRTIFVNAKERTDRYPNAAGDCYRPQMIADTNMPPGDHWLPIMAGLSPIPDGLPEEERRLLVKPKDWEILVQPPAMFELRDREGKVEGYRINPERENAKHAGARYYENLLSGQTRTRIASMVLNRPGLITSGKAVWPEYVPEEHVAAAPLLAVPGHPIMIGVDFGRTPAAVIGQCPQGKWRILRELIADNMGAKDFARLLKRTLAQSFPEFNFSLWGDPRGEDAGQADDNSPFLMFRAAGLPILPAPTNDPVLRTNAVRELFLSRDRILVSPVCITLKTACAGGYSYRRLRISGAADRYADTPDKNRYSHIADALQYLVMGGGEGAALLGRIKPGAGRMTGTARVVRPARPRGWAALERRR